MLLIARLSLSLSVSLSFYLSLPAFSLSLSLSPSLPTSLSLSLSLSLSRLSTCPYRYVYSYTHICASVYTCMWGCQNIFLAALNTSGCHILETPRGTTLLKTCHIDGNSPQPFDRVWVLGLRKGSSTSGMLLLIFSEIRSLCAIMNRSCLLLCVSKPSSNRRVLRRVHCLCSY